MGNPIVHFSTVLLAFFAIMNPIANAPLFLGLTGGLDALTRRRIAIRSVIIAFLIVASFALLGRVIFSAFGITLPAFRIAGGALIALVGFQMLQGTGAGASAPVPGVGGGGREAAIGIAVSPLAIPILGGPGAIATAMSFAAETSAAEISRVLAALGVICLANLVAFLGSDRLVRFLGRDGTQVVGRLMGLILAVIGTQMLITGIRGAIGAG